MNARIQQHDGPQQHQEADKKGDADVEELHQQQEDDDDQERRGDPQSQGMQVRVFCVGVFGFGPSGSGSFVLGSLGLALRVLVRTCGLGIRVRSSGWGLRVRVSGLRSYG